MLKRRIAQLALAATLTAQLAGCYTVRYDVTTLPDNQVQMTRAGKASGQKFSQELRAIWVAYGLLPIFRPDVKEAIREASHGKRVQNVTFKDEMTPVDAAVNVTLMIGSAVGFWALGAGPVATLTMLVVPTFRTVTVEGEILP